MRLIGLYHEAEQANESATDQRGQTDVKCRKALVEALLGIIGDRDEANFGGAECRNRCAEPQVPARNEELGQALFARAVAAMRVQDQHDIERCECAKKSQRCEIHGVAARSTQVELRPALPLS